MSTKSGQKNTDKVQFVKIEPRGGVSNAFPNRPADGGVSASEDGPQLSLNMDSSDHEEDFRIEPADPNLEGEISILRARVEAIPADGGSLDSTQMEVLKKYIALKEMEVRDLKEQHRQYQTYLKKISKDLQSLSLKNHELVSNYDTVRRREESSRSEVSNLQDRHREELDALRLEYEDKLRHAENVDLKNEELIRTKEEWREKVQSDLKRIKLKERELENKHELLKRDMQALLDAKDHHLLELKKKTDALELEMETMEEKLRSSNSILSQMRSKKRRLTETMRLAQSLLETIDDEVSTDNKNKDDSDK